MASLTHPHWEAVPPLLRDLLAEIGQIRRRGAMAGAALVRNLTER